MRKLPFATTIVCILVPCCIAGLVRADEIAPLQTSIYSASQCPVSQASTVTTSGAVLLGGVLLSAVISQAVDTVIDRAVSVLKEAAQDKDFAMASPPPTPLKFYEITSAGSALINSEINCIIVLRGKVGRAKPLISEYTTESTLDRIMNGFLITEDDEVGPNSLVTRLLEPPVFYSEYALVTSSEGDEIALRPQVLYVSDFQSDDGFFGPSTRTYKTVVNFVKQTSQAPFLSASFKFENVSRGEGRIQCESLRNDQPCMTTTLGPEQGWAATLPTSSDVATKQSARKRAADMVALAFSNEKLMPPVYADAQPSVRPYQNVYCKLIAEHNAFKDSPQKFNDDSCPVALSDARRNFSYALTVAQLDIDKAKAKQFVARQCPKASDRLSAAACLAKPPNLGNVLAGDFSVTATVVETRPGNEVAKFLAPVAESASADVKTSLKEQLDPAERKKAREAAAAQDAANARKASDARYQLKVAMADVLKANNERTGALKALEASPDDTSLQNKFIDAELAILEQQRAANDSARAVGDALPFPAVD